MGICVPGVNPVFPRALDAGRRPRVGMASPSHILMAPTVLRATPIVPRTRACVIGFAGDQPGGQVSPRQGKRAAVREGEQGKGVAAASCVSSTGL
jgi:hypothetical protein